MSQLLQAGAVGLFAAGDYEAASDAALRSTRLPQDINNPHTDSYLLIAASLAHLGRLEEARAALDEAKKRRPALREELLSVYRRGASKDYQERYLEGLRLAGLRE
jgi:tetratricopeptide (TPR) repeat protein